MEKMLLRMFNVEDPLLGYACNIKQISNMRTQDAEATKWDLQLVHNSQRLLDNQQQRECKSDTQRNHQRIRAMQDETTKVRKYERFVLRMD
jgi:hypothetical protein